MGLLDEIAQQRPERYVVNAQARLTATEFENLKKVADEVGVTRSELIRHFVRLGLDEAQKLMQQDRPAS
jgi:metal-responsive CopG/Arc/MetJ family transcriptional regulator